MPSMNYSEWPVTAPNEALRLNPWSAIARMRCITMLLPPPVRMLNLWDAQLYQNADECPSRHAPDICMNGKVPTQRCRILPMVHIVTQ